MFYEINKSVVFIIFSHFCACMNEMSENPRFINVTITSTVIHERIEVMDYKSNCP